MSTRTRGIGLRRKQAADAAGLMAVELAERLSKALGRTVTKQAIYDMWAGRSLGPEMLTAYARVVGSTPAALEVPVPEAEQPPIQRKHRRRGYSRVEKPDRNGLPDATIRQVLLALEQQMRLKGLNQRELATKAGVHWTTLGDWLRSARAGQGRLPMADRLPVLAGALGTTLQALVAGPPPEAPVEAPKRTGSPVGTRAPQGPGGLGAAEILDESLDWLGLSIGTEHLINRAGVRTVRELTELSAPVLLREVRLSPLQVKEVQSKLAERGLMLATPPPEQEKPEEEAKKPGKAEKPVASVVPAAPVQPEPEVPPELQPEAQAEVQPEPRTTYVPELFVPDLMGPGATMEMVPYTEAPADPFGGGLYREAEELVLLLGEQAEELVRAGRNLLKWLAFASHTLSTGTMVAAITRCHEEALALIVDLRLMRAQGKFSPRLGVLLEERLLGIAEKLRALGVDDPAALTDTLG